MELHKKIKSAVRDLLYLLEQDYPRKASVELVGNRYGMTSQERMVLYRAVFPRDVCERRMQKRWCEDAASFEHCVIDGYNVFISIESYLQGRLVFKALDGFTRDVSGVYGNYAFGEKTPRAAELITRVLQQHLGAVSLFTFYLDYPVSKSGEFAGFLREKMEKSGLSARVEVVKNPDGIISMEHATDLIATSDSALIDGGKCCIDIPDLVFSGIMAKAIPDLQLLMSEELPWLSSLLQ
jgi:hypothetical protein